MTYKPFLEGEQIFLRPLSREDLEGNYINWLNDPEVAKYNSHYRLPYTRERAEEYLTIKNKATNEIFLAIVEKNSHKHVGNITLKNINWIDQSAEFAIVLGERDCWGKGYSKEAAKLICQHGFFRLNLKRIYCGTSKENLPMQRLAVFLGMKEEGCSRQALYKQGVFYDVINYGVLAEEFIQKFKI